MREKGNIRKDKIPSQLSDFMCLLFSSLQPIHPTKNASVKGRKEQKKNLAMLENMKNFLIINFPLNSPCPEVSQSVRT